LDWALKPLDCKTHPNDFRDGKYHRTIGKHVDNWFMVGDIKFEFENKYNAETTNYYGSQYDREFGSRFSKGDKVEKFVTITYPNLPRKRCYQDNIHVFHIDDDLSTPLKRRIAGYKLRAYVKRFIDKLQPKKTVSPPITSYIDYLELYGQLINTPPKQSTSIQLEPPADFFVVALGIQFVSWSTTTPTTHPAKHPVNSNTTRNTTPTSKLTSNPTAKLHTQRKTECIYANLGTEKG